MDAAAILLVDVSGSMDMHDCAEGKTRYKVACEQLLSLQRSLEGKIAVVAFSDRPFFCPGGIPPMPNGGTDLTAALKFIQPADGCGIRFVVISDGEPDNGTTAIELANKFTTKIDTVYCGPETGAGREFLSDLAAASGGVFAGQSVKDLPNLAQTVERLLSA
ncbi:von willebrand factor (vwF) type a domain protein [Bacteriophage sp.]|nr:von willebrand factor (vwF) type a domain protein [Bacteriophage sp.]